GWSFRSLLTCLLALRIGLALRVGVPLRTGLALRVGVTLRVGVVTSSGARRRGVRRGLRLTFRTGALVAHRFGTRLVLGGLLGAAGGGTPVVLPGQLQADQRGRPGSLTLVRAAVVE